MRLLEIEISRAIRFLQIEQIEPLSKSVANVARDLEREYGFYEGPRKVEDFDYSKGIVYRHGEFEGRIIDRFVVYNNGVLAETTADTSVAAAFIESVSAWVTRETGAIIRPGSIPGKPYFSALTVECSPLVGSVMKALSTLPREIRDRLISYDIPDLPVDFWGFIIAPDPASGVEWSFRFERRVGKPFSDNCFYSTAPLTTADHLALLESLEDKFSMAVQ